MLTRESTLGFVITSLLAFAPVARADILRVPDEYPTIQAAIDVAQDHDVVLVADGVYTGPGNKDLDFCGKTITLQSENGAENCAIDCEGEGRGLYFHSGETRAALVDGFTIRNGRADYGGGIHCHASSPTIDNCVITANTASSGVGHGGGLCLLECSPVVVNCTIANNTALVGGGVDCWSACAAVIEDCIIAGNQAHYDGGGVACSDANNPTITRCAITGNSARFGGGVVCWNQCSATLTNCIISTNWAQTDGGGVFCFDSAVVINNCLVCGNAAEEDGGALLAWQTTVTFANCTCATNSAPNGKGLACDSWFQAYPSNIEMSNCVVWNGGDDVWNNDNSVINVTYTDIYGGWHGTGNISVDPLFADPNNGDYRLTSGSPCIDAGDNEAVLADTLDLDEDGNADEPIPFDLDGNPRFIDDPGTEDTGNPDPDYPDLPIVDMGAYEFQVPCPGDVDGDGDTDHSDLGGLLSVWDSEPGDPAWDPNADLDGDGRVGHGDLGILLADWACGT